MDLPSGKVYQVVNKKSITCFFGSFSRNFFFCLFVLALVWPTAASAELRVVSDLSGRDCSPWERIELLEDSDPHFVAEPFHIKGRQDHSIIKKAFNTGKPHSRNVLLHYAPSWNRARSSKTPILLVHGAGDNACRGFCHPWSFDIPEDGNITRPGLMQFLVQRGFSVFGITFSHPHGDNFLQAQQVANAISRIREVTGAARVDVVCHSKGAMSVRIYASDLGKQYPEYSWLTPFRRDIRRIVFVASPLKGIDTAFRYYMYNFTVKQQNLAAPLGARSMMWQGMFVSNENHNRLFPGQFQMLHNWGKDGIELNHQSLTADANLSRNALYKGGVTALLVSDGIDRAIHEAGNVIESLNRKGIDPSVTCHILAGSKQEIDKVKFFWLEFPVGEFADQSDGVLFLKSATYKAGLTARGARVNSVKVLNTHHVGLTVLPEALNHIAEVLSERDPD
jgi:pimeloyl-ACP methyl ester carboxylesterase